MSVASVTTTQAAHQAGEVITKLARKADANEVKSVATTLVDRGVGKDMFNLSTKNTFYVKAPNIPIIRPLVIWFKEFRIRHLAKKAGLQDVAIIFDLGEKLAPKYIKRQDKMISFFAKRLDHSGRSLKKELHAEVGETGLVDNKHTVVWYNLSRFNKPAPTT